MGIISAHDGKIRITNAGNIAVCSCCDFNNYIYKNPNSNNFYLTYPEYYTDTYCNGDIPAFISIRSIMSEWDWYTRYSIMSPTPPIANGNTISASSGIIVIDPRWRGESWQHCNIKCAPDDPDCDDGHDGYYSYPSQTITIGGASYTTVERRWTWNSDLERYVETQPDEYLPTPSEFVADLKSRGFTILLSPNYGTNSNFNCGDWCLGEQEDYENSPGNSGTCQTCHGQDPSNWVLTSAQVRAAGFHDFKKIYSYANANCTKWRETGEPEYDPIGIPIGIDGAQHIMWQIKYDCEKGDFIKYPPMAYCCPSYIVGNPSYSSSLCNAAKDDWYSPDYASTLEKTYLRITKNLTWPTTPYHPKCLAKFIASYDCINQSWSVYQDGAFMSGGSVSTYGWTKYINNDPEQGERTNGTFETIVEYDGNNPSPPSTPAPCYWQWTAYYSCWEESWTVYGSDPYSSHSTTDAHDWTESGNYMVKVTTSSTQPAAPTGEGHCVAYWEAYWDTETEAWVKYQTWIDNGDPAGWTCYGTEYASGSFEIGVTPDDPDCA